MRDSLSIASTVVIPALASETTFVTPSQGNVTLRVASNRNVHISVDGAAADANDFPVFANCPEIISGLVPGSTVRFVKGAGETDGSIWVSLVSLQ